VIELTLQKGERLRRTFGSPRRVLEARTLDEVAGVVDGAWEAAQAGAWVVGMVSYEAAPAFDPVLSTHPAGPLPLAWFGIFEPPLVTPRPRDDPPGRFAFGRWQRELSVADHGAAVEKVRAAIREGATYQLNLTDRLRASFEGDPLAAWETLQRRQEGDYGAFLDLGRFCIASASPELFFRWEEGCLVTRPMKGTRARAADPEADLRAGQALLGSEKDRAENAMIVDLLRNDLGRVAVTGSVRTPERFTLERYPTVWQLTSTVEARTRPGCTLREVLTALFPCGSITGAPKVHTMALTRALERSPRGAYCGAIGLMEPGGRSTFSVAIRTLTLDLEAGEAAYGTGGGITWDSEPAAEWAESVAKTRILPERSTPPAELLASLRLEDGRWELKADHLERLETSAQSLGFGSIRGAVGSLLETVQRAHPQGTHRVRVIVSPEGRAPDGKAGAAQQVPGERPAAAPATLQKGRVRVEVGPMVATPSSPRVTLGAHPLMPPACFHKTTARAGFEAVLAAAPPGTFDVLLLREGGLLTEFTRGNLILERPDGSRWTPILASGLLPGSRRAHLLAQGTIREARLTVADLPGARLWFVNGLRGEVEVQLANGP